MVGRDDRSDPAHTRPAASMIARQFGLRVKPELRVSIARDDVNARAK
jgi:hypothetical protein